MKWIKRGFLFKPNSNLYWSRSHAQNPTIEFISDSILRIYYASRDVNNKSYIGFFDWDLRKNKIYSSLEEPILKPEFEYERDGVHPSTILNVNKKKFLYYIGFISFGRKFSATINLAISDDGITFYKYKKNPVIGIDSIDPLLVTNPTVLRHENIYLMFYTSGFKFQEFSKNNNETRLFFTLNDLNLENINKVNNKKENRFDIELRSFYSIKLAISEDVINFKKTDKIIFPLDQSYVVFNRMSILRENNLYRGWYCYQKINDDIKKAYRIGYAESLDLYNWIRMEDQVGISCGPENYDNEMMAYPQVFKYNGIYFMLYNGNNYGKEGILYAISY